MDSFHAKISWKRLRNSEKKKNILSIRPDPSRNIKFQKNSEKRRKIKQYQYGLISGQNRLEKSEKERK